MNLFPWTFRVPLQLFIRRIMRCFVRVVQVRRGERENGISCKLAARLSVTLKHTSFSQQLCPHVCWKLSHGKILPGLKYLMSYSGTWSSLIQILSAVKTWKINWQAEKTSILLIKTALKSLFPSVRLCLQMKKSDFVLYYVKTFKWIIIVKKIIVYFQFSQIKCQEEK